MRKLFFITLSIAVFASMIFGAFTLLKNEEDRYPKYIIRSEDRIYRTDTFSVDINNVIRFTDISHRISGSKRSKVEIHDRYTITEKYK